MKFKQISLAAIISFSSPLFIFSGEEERLLMLDVNGPSAAGGGAPLYLFIRVSRVIYCVQAINKTITSCHRESENLFRLRQVLNLACYDGWCAQFTFLLPRSLQAFIF